MLSFSLFHGFSFSSSPSSLFNAFRFLTILPSSRFPDHWRRFIDAVSTAQRAGRERERESTVRAQRLLLHWEARYFDYQRKTNVAVIELERLARLGIISISVLASKPCVWAFISSKLYRKEKRILLEDRGCLLWRRNFFSRIKIKVKDEDKAERELVFSWNMYHLSLLSTKSKKISTL